MTKETADRLSNILCEVVEEGTGMPAAVPNVRIAGKTGTAQRIKEGGKGYEAGMYISSFIGFVADRDPKILCLIMVDSPEGVYYGSQVAGPVFKSIINRILNMGNGPFSPNQVIAETKPDSATKTVQASTFPGLKNVDMNAFVDKIKKMNIVSSSSKKADNTSNKGSGSAAYPANRPIPINEIVTVEQDSLIRVPYVCGKTLREAARIMAMSNIKISLTGSGKVVEQNPPAGTLICNGAICQLICKR